MTNKIATLQNLKPVTPVDRLQRHLERKVSANVGVCPNCGSTNLNRDYQDAIECLGCGATFI